MKAIMISIKPEWVAKILNGEKTIEIRKTMPKCDLPIDVYIYCTKDNKQGLVWDNQGKGLVNSSLFPYGKNCPERHRLVNGKVVAKFTVRKVEAIDIWQEDLKEKMKLACLSIKEFDDYSKGQVAYAYHIEDLVIFDKPKELSEFKHWVFYKECSKCPYGKCDYDYGLCSQCCEIKPLTKAPQNFMYIESEE